MLPIKKRNKLNFKIQIHILKKGDKIQHGKEESNMEKETNINYLNTEPIFNMASADTQEKKLATCNTLHMLCLYNFAVRMKIFQMKKNHLNSTVFRDLNA